MDDKFFLKFSQPWFNSSSSLKITELCCVQVIETGITYTKYEAFVFDDIHNMRYYGIAAIMPYINQYEDPYKLQNIFDFKQISDTYIQFKLDRMLDPEIYDFMLLYAK